MSCDAARILHALQAQAADSLDRDALATAAVRSIREALPQASWVGVYWLEGRELVLGPYEGPPTEHTRIPVGRGVCGTAVEEERDQLVHDVKSVSNYLACSPDVLSELVVLIRAEGRIVGQLDLDAAEAHAFSEDDQCVLRAVADGFGALIELADATPPPSESGAA